MNDITLYGDRYDGIANSYALVRSKPLSVPVQRNLMFKAKGPFSKILRLKTVPTEIDSEQLCVIKIKNKSKFITLIQ